MIDSVSIVSTLLKLSQSFVYFIFAAICQLHCFCLRSSRLNKCFLWNVLLLYTVYIIYILHV